MVFAAYTERMFEYTVRTFWSIYLCFLIYTEKVIHHFPAHIFPNQNTTRISSLSFLLYLSLSTGMIACDHYARECEFGILKKKTTKQNNKNFKHKLSQRK